METIDAAAFEAIMRGEDPFAGTRNQPPKKPTREVRNERDDKKRNEGGIDLSGTLPAPA